MKPESNVPSTHLLKYAGIARSASQASRDLLLGSFARVSEYKIRGEDIKLREDRESQTKIVEHLRYHSGFPILTEESGWEGAVPHSGELYWVVDPLDGSFNFYAGIPLFAVSIALCVDSTSIIGCVFDVLRNQVFTGGANLPMRINNELQPFLPHSNRMLATGFPVSRNSTGFDLRHEGGDWRKIRMLGSAALSLAWVAAGRLGGYREKGIRWYDVAGGLALVQAVGGVTSVTPHSAGEEWSPLRPLNVSAHLKSS